MKADADDDPWWIGLYGWLIEREDRCPYKWILRAIHRLGDIKWWIFHRFHPGHRYNVVHTGEPPGYYDPDHQIEHAVLKVFADWYVRNDVEKYDYDGRYEASKEIHRKIGGRDARSIPHEELTDILVAIMRQRGRMWD